jgi:hydroxypyruvate isomerase
VPAKEIAEQLKQHRLEMALFNAPPGEYAAGDRGTASLPGREHEFAAGSSRRFAAPPSSAARAST